MGRLVIPGIFARLFQVWPVWIILCLGCSGLSRKPDAAFTPLPQTAENRQDQNTSDAPASAAGATDPSQTPAGHRCGQRFVKACKAVFTKPWYGYYLGPDNYGYDKKPIDALDAAAREHDLAYDQCHAAGIAGALFCLDAGKADLHLAGQAFRALPSLDFPGKLAGVSTGLTMGFLGLVKEPCAELRSFLIRRHSPTTPPGRADSDAPEGHRSLPPPGEPGASATGDVIHSHGPQ
jgi:hypothetical protein